MVCSVCSPSKQAPANRPRPVATPPSPDPGPLGLGPVGEAGRLGGRASRCWFWEAEPAASGPVRVAHMAPTPGFAGGVRGRGAPHLGPGELPAQLGDTSSRPAPSWKHGEWVWPALPPRTGGQQGWSWSAGRVCQEPGGLAEGQHPGSLPGRSRPQQQGSGDPQKWLRLQGPGEGAERGVWGLTFPDVP